MKAYNLLVVILLALFVASCKEDSAVETTNQENINNTPIVNFAVGNEYYIHFVNFSGIAIVDWYQTNVILRDTTIENNKYFIFSDGKILRSTAISVVQWNNVSETIFYRFDVNVDDIISFQNNQLKVQEVKTDTVYIGAQKVEAQKVIYASNTDFTPDTTVNIVFSTKFGLLSSSKSVSGKSWNESLSGVKLDTIKYGNIWP